METTNTFVRNLPLTGFRVRVPIPVVIEEYEDGFLAKWADVRVHGLGSTSSQALARLKFSIVRSYCYLMDFPKEELGLIALHDMQVFETHIQGDNDGWRNE